MPCLFRWLFYGCFGRAMATMFALLAVFIIVEAFDKARYLGRGLNTGLLLEYLLLKSPFMMSEFMPVILLLAVSLYVTELSRHHELVALRAAGLGVPKLLIPLLCVAILAGAFSFVVGEWVTPVTNKRVDRIEQIHIHHRPDTDQGTQWLKDESRFFRMQPLGIGQFRLTMLETDGAGRWLRRIDASLARYQQGVWLLQDVYISKPGGKEGLQLAHRPSMELASRAGPGTADPPKPRHMNFFQLKQYIHNLQRAGLATAGFEYALHRKLSAPIACVIMILLAISMCMGTGSRLSASSLGILASIGLGLIFYILGNASDQFSRGEYLPPYFAAWLPDMIFGGLAGFLLLQREGY